MSKRIITAKRYILIFALMGFVALTISFIAVLVSGGSQMEKTGTPGLRGFADGFIVPEPLEVSIARADSIALVTVEEVGRARWSTADGQGSIAAVQKAIRSEKDAPVIYRPVTLKVEKYLKNPQPETTLTIHQLGGEVDGVIFEASWDIGFQKDMRAVVFLARQKPPSPIDWDLGTVYVIQGAITHSKWDQRSVRLDELLSTIMRLTGQTP